MTYSSNFSAKDGWTNGTTAIDVDHVASIYTELGSSPGTDISTLEGYPYAIIQLVSTGSESRPTLPNANCRVLWIGGSTQPSNMASGDLWFKDTP